MITKPSTLLCWLYLLMFSPAVVLAKPLVALTNDTPLLNNSFDADLPVVISASRLNQSILKAPSAVTVLDREIIEASGFTDIADLFRLVPGFQSVRADGRTFASTYHGGGWEMTSRLQVLVNGRSTYMPTLSTVDWDILGVHINDIDRIEVVRGPSSSAYGSNSFSAAINIITRPIALDSRFETQVRVGDRGEREVFIKTNQLGDLLNYRLSAWHHQDNGFDHYPDDRRFNNLSIQLDPMLSPDQDLSLYLALAEGDTGIEHNQFYPKRDRDVNAASAHISWANKLNSRYETKLNFYHNYSKNDDLVESLPLSEVFGITPDQFEALFASPDQTLLMGTHTFTTAKTDLEWQLSGIQDSGLQYVVGIGGRYETFGNSVFLEDDVTATTLRAFSNFQLPIGGRWTVNGGAIIERDDFQRNYFSPRASINWRFSNLQSLRLGYGKAWRIPSLLEKNFAMKTTLDNGVVVDERILADPSLKAEELTSVDLGWIGKHQEYPLQWELKLYRERIDNIMRFVLDESITNPIGIEREQIANVGYYITDGFEGELIYRPLKKSFLRFHFNWGRNEEYARRRAIAPYKYITNTNRAPQSSVGLLFSHAWRNWQVSSALYHVDSMRWTGKGDEVDAYTRFDISASRVFSIGPKQSLSFKLAAQNLGQSYHEFSFRQRVEPRYYISVTFSEH